MSLSLIDGAAGHRRSNRKAEMLSMETISTLGQSRWHNLVIFLRSRELKLPTKLSYQNLRVKPQTEVVVKNEYYVRLHRNIYIFQLGAKKNNH